jgi:hypothetical protein
MLFYQIGLGSDALVKQAFPDNLVLRLPNFIFSRVANKMLEVDPNARSSKWWDVSQGKPTQIKPHF